MNSNIIKTIRNKYFLATLAFVLLLLLNDRNSLFDQYEYSKNLKEVKEKHRYYQQEITKVRNQQKELFGSAKNLEKFAREKYLMKRDNEDIFVMVEE
ncbi:MAG: septum formation initiator family protein [Bacteroidota bacterium]|nr:septum formation initiator family protein [Bacteroidota bacterium]